MADITVFLGAPGSGKGTQAKRLASSQGFKHFSTGDMLRAAIRSGSDTGKKAKSYLDGGELVPDDVMIELIQDAIREAGSSARIILDGFPRTVPQAEALDAVSETRVNRAIYFKVPQAALVRRLTGRRVCERCGESFHVVFLPPKKEGTCDKCGGNLVQRSDDTEEVVQRRLEIFAEQNNRLLDFFRKSGKLHELNGDRPIEELQKQLIELLR